MYTTVAEFVRDWEWETAISLKVERALTDASLQQKTDPEGRTLGQLAWHMSAMIGLTGSALGLDIEAPPRGSEPPSSAAKIADAYQSAARSMSAQAGGKLTDARLSEEVQLFGRTLPVATALQSLVRHQIHHRGEMMIVMRQAGLVPPGVYGPTREESAAMRAKQAPK